MILSQSRHLKFLFAAFTLVFLSAPSAFADTIDFTVTITSQAGGPIPLGSVFYGSVTYAGSVDPNFTGVPPVLTSYTFDYPGAPASIYDLNFAFVQRPAIGAPLFVDLGYEVLGEPYGVFDLADTTFMIYTANGPIPPGSVLSGGSYPWETGTVTYSYPPSTSTVPEPSSMVLLGTGLLGGFELVRRRCLAG